VISLRKPKSDDLDEIKSAYERSVLIHLPWTHEPGDLDAYLSDEYRYFAYLDSTLEIVGTLNISGLVRGYFQSAYLGYEVFVPHQGKGYMKAGLNLLLDVAFTKLNLHRLEANIQPGNEASIKLVSQAGFVKEGFSRHYLNIGGLGWVDHERWAIINEKWSTGNS
jgi:ribosomal-protein-alanine N-acetyltransferase